MAMVGVVGLIPLLLIFSPLAYSVTDSQALLDFKRSLINANALNSWQPGSDPCAQGTEWAGVICYKGIVTGLRLEQMGLSGTIDVNSLALVPGLRTISFLSNAFTGPIPPFNKLGSLKALFLSGNRFTGPIPSDFFSKMGSLKKIWLSNNNFSGEIPSSVSKLAQLIELNLENNQFSGPIPSMEQSTLVSLNLANNKLEGEIPASMSKFSANSFQGNANLCGGQVGRQCDPAKLKPGQEAGAKHDSTKLAAGIITAVVVVVTLLCVAIFLMRRKQEKVHVLGKENPETTVEVQVSTTVKKENKEESSSVKKGAGSNRGGSAQGRKGVGDMVLVNEEKGAFGLPDLMKAAAEVLGNGSFGSSYKATMGNGLTVVVKRMKEINKLGRDEFDTEMRRFGGLKHKNILPPLAYHYRKEEKLMIYERIPKGSLHYILHGKRAASQSELNWPVRLRMIQGIARGLGFLHTELASIEVPHGNLKSSNVLVSDNFEPLLVDYGLSQFITATQASKSLFAYKSPEATQGGIVSPKSDVYCLGIVILEILTRKFPSQYLNNGKGGIDVVEWVKSAILEKREAELLDPELTSAANVAHSVSDMEKLLQIGVACAETSPDLRLDIREAIKRIEEIQISQEQGAMMM